MVVMLESRAPDLGERVSPADDREQTLAQITVELREVPTRLTPAAALPIPRLRRPRWRRVELSPWTARVAGLLIFVGFVAGTAVEPPANGPQPVLPFWANALATTTLVVLLGCWAGLAAGRRSGLRLGVAAGTGLVAMTVACPAVDHHAIAGWWWGQLTVSVGILLLSAGLLAATGPGHTG